MQVPYNIILYENCKSLILRTGTETDDEHFFNNRIGTETEKILKIPSSAANVHETLLIK